MLSLVILSKVWWSPKNNVVYFHHKCLMITHLIVLSVNGQCFAEKQAQGEVSQELLETQVNPAVREISGHIVLKRREDFENALEDYAWRLLAEVSLSEESFQEVKAHISEAAGLHGIDTEAYSLHQNEEAVPTSSAPTATSHLHQDCPVVKGGA